MSKRKLDILNTLKDQGVKLTPMEIIALENQIDLQDTMMNITNSIKVAKGEDGKDGVDGKDGKDGLNGKDGKDGKNGNNGKDGKDGITPIKGKDYLTDADITDIAMSVESQLAPIVMEVGNSIEELGLKIEENVKTPEDIRDMLESLQDESRLDAKAIKNLPQTISKIEKQVTGMRGIKDVYDSTGVKSTGSLGIKFTGTGVGSVSEYNGITTIDIIGGVTPANDQVKTSIADTTRGYLDEKLTVSSPLTKTIVNPGGNETLNLAMPVATSSVDGYLDNADWTTFNNKENVLSFTSPLSRTGNTVTTSMATNKLIGRGTAGTGVFEEITLGTGLSFSGTTLNATGTIDGSGTTNQITYWVDTDTIGALSTATYPSLTELSYGKGVTSAIQTQLDAKMTNPMTTGGDVIYGGASGVPTRLANGTNGQVLTSSGGTTAPTWTTVSGGGGITIGTTTITSGTANRVLIHSASGDTVQEDSGLVWDFTQNKLSIVGTSTFNLSSPSSGTIYGGSYPASIVSPNNGTAYGIGAASAVSSGVLFVANGYNAGNTATTKSYWTAIGGQAFGNSAGANGFALGYNNQANNGGGDTICIGQTGLVNATDETGSVMFGSNVGIGSTVGFYNLVAGDNAYAAGANAWGNVVLAPRGGQTVGGHYWGNRNTIVGYAADVDADLTGACAWGAGAIAKTSNTMVFGGTITAPTRAYFGLGETSATPTSIIVSPTSASGANVAGADWNAAAGQGSGTGTGGNYNIQTASAGSTGSALNALVTRLRVDTNGNIRAFSLHDNATAQGSATNQDIRSGTYTATLTGVANVSASTARKAQWSRVGNVVTVAGQLDIDPTTTLTLTQIGISLPVASNFATAFALGGTGISKTGNICTIEADATNDRAQLEILSPVDVTNQTVTYQFSYEVI